MDAVAFPRVAAGAVQVVLWALRGFRVRGSEFSAETFVKKVTQRREDAKGDGFLRAFASLRDRATTTHATMPMVSTLQGPSSEFQVQRRAAASPFFSARPVSRRACGGLNSEVRTWNSEL